MADRTHHLVADPDAGRVDAWLAGRLPLSRSRLQDLIRTGRVTVDGHPVRPSFRLQGGEAVVVREPPPEPSTLQPEAIPVPILHLDDQVVVVDKPAGLVVHPGRGHPTGTLVHALLHLLDGAPPPAEAALRWHDDPPRPGIVHRLDRGTSGVMVVARTAAAHARLAEQFAEHSTERRYAALVWGEPPADRGTVDAPLRRDPRNRLRFAVLDGGRRAVTHWRVLGRAALPGGRGAPVALVECRLETGRTHQVRVHMRHIGLPLVGDPLYGPARPPWPESLADLRPEHQLLHARTLAFDHPATGERLRFSSPLRPRFAALVERLGLALP